MPGIMRARWTLLALALSSSSFSGLALAEPPASASPPNVSKNECVAAYVAAQQERLDGHLRAARDHLEVCAEEACPAAVNVDCRQWLNEVSASLPTIVFAARSPNGKDVPHVRVFVDGHLEVENLDGRPSAFDPGDHVLRFEAAGFEAAQESILVHQGERDRVVIVTLRPTAGHDASQANAGTRGRVPTSAYVLGAVGVAATAIGTYLALSGINDAKHLQTTCKPACAESDVAAARTKIVAGNVGVGVGLVALAGAVWVYLAEPRSAAPSATQGPTAPPGRRTVELELNAGTRTAALGLSLRF